MKNLKIADIIRISSERNARKSSKAAVTKLVSDDGINALFRTDTGDKDKLYESYVSVVTRPVASQRWLSKL